MQANLRKFVETLLGSQRELSFSTLGPDGFPQSVMAGYASEGSTVFIGAKARGSQVRNLASSAKACITVVSHERDWGDVRGVTLRGHAVVLPEHSAEIERARRLLQRKFPESRRLSEAASPALAFIRFDPLAVAVLDHWDGVGFSELIDVSLDA